MAASGIGLFDLADKRLAWVQQRQALLAQNIANASTPGWKARDLKPFSAALARQSGVPLRTDPAHLAGRDRGAEAAQVRGERAPDGNAVKLDEELTKVADAESTQAMVANIYGKYLSFFKLAAGR